jgi:ERF superfamily
MTGTETLGKLAAALAKAQGEITGAEKDSRNPQFNARYASLAAIWDACRAPLSKHALSVLQPVRAEGAKVTVQTILLHDSGEWISEELTINALAPTPQGVGSAITYGRKYGLASMVGVAPDDDDDGEVASQSSQSSQVPRPVRTETTAPRPTPPTPPEQKSVAAGVGKDLLISVDQVKRFHTIASKAGWKPDELKAWLEEVWMLTSSRDIPRKKYDVIIEQVERGAPPADGDVAPF